jgi:hypothetical protein
VPKRRNFAQSWVTLQEIVDDLVSCRSPGELQCDGSRRIVATSVDPFDGSENEPDILRLQQLEQTHPSRPGIDSMKPDFGPKVF